MMADIFGVRGLVRKSVGACAVRMEDARTLASKHSAPEANKAVANQLSETTIRVRKQLFGSSQIEESQP